MGRVVMSCEDVRQALPLLSGTSPDEAARVRAHALACEGCALLLRAYEQDDRVLAAASGARVAAPVMTGFTGELMARIAAEERVRRAPPLPLLLRPTVRAAMAMAAAVLLTIALALSSDRAVEAPAPPPQVADRQPTVGPPAVQIEALPAPRLDREQVPMPVRRGRGPVVPVDGGSRGARGPSPEELIDMIEGVLPFRRARSADEREVKF
jgi:hypothetical protein